MYFPSLQIIICQQNECILPSKLIFFIKELLFHESISNSSLLKAHIYLGLTILLNVRSCLFSMFANKVRSNIPYAFFNATTSYSRPLDKNNSQNFPNLTLSFIKGNDWFRQSLMLFIFVWRGVGKLILRPLLVELIVKLSLSYFSFSERELTL